MIKQCDPNSIEDTLKEAVAESILGNIYQKVSGEGDYGKYVIVDRPSRKFVSGFIEPAYVATRGNRIIDEMTNPIHVITIGMDFQAIKSSEAKFSVNSKFAIYVRVLPSEQDLIKHKVHLEYSAEVKQAIRDLRRNFYDQFRTENEDLFKRDKIEFYKKQKTELREAIRNLLVRHYNVIFNDEIIESNSVNINEEDLVRSESLREGESLEKSSSETIVENTDNAENDQIDNILIAFPGMSSTIPDNVAQSVRPPQKWLRLDINDIPELIVPVSINNESLNRLLNEYNVSLRQAIERKLLSWIQDSDPDNGGKFWAFPSDLTLTANEIKNWNDTLNRLRQDFHSHEDPLLFSLPQIDLQLAVEISNNYENAEIRNIRVSLENITAVVRNNIQTEIDESVFQVGLSVSIFRKHHVMLKLDRIKPSYQYNQYLIYPAIGFNNGIQLLVNGENLTLKTTWMPIYAQPRVRAQEYDEINVSFEKLATADGTTALLAFPVKFNEWIDNVESKLNPSFNIPDKNQKEIENDRFKNDIKAWRRESDKIHAGIKLLIDSLEIFNRDPSDIKSIPFRAWSLMQETMRDAAEKKGFKKWRLFQVAFILVNICGIVSRMEEFNDQNYYDEKWDEAVSLLHFSTGGGKTESFFGLLVFNLFLDRLRGKSIGVTAMLRYPLRLLTTQQAQRLADVLAIAERIRWKYKIQGNPFEIGFWVGSATTGNWRKDYNDSQIPVFNEKNEPKEEELLKNPEYLYAKEKWNKLPECPFCRGKTVLRKYRNRNGLIGHACINERTCAWNDKHGGAKKVPLPFYIVDEDIYEVAPSVILGTIDKLALIGQSPSTIRRFFGMLGFSPHFNTNTCLLITPKSPVDINDSNGKDGVVRLQPIYKNGEKLFHDPYPSLIIQDEAHLLEESLGTFSGIFQTTFEHILKVLGEHPRMNHIMAKVPGTNYPRMPKIIAASATVTEPERQMEAIFQRDVYQFPWPGPELYKSFYSAPIQRCIDNNMSDWSEEECAMRARFYASLMTNGKPHTSTTVSILANFHLIITEFMSFLTNDDPSLRTIARKNLIQGLLDTRLKTLYISAIEKATDEELATVIDLHRISLTYVTNKKGGDQIMAAVNDATSRAHEDNGIENFPGLNSELISGAISANDIEEVVRKAQHRPKKGDDVTNILDHDIIRSIVATSAISHGVDVNEFNSMFFAGMPSSISEYIQASSRVGRTHVGLSLLIPTPHQRRDRYILEIHDIYHRFLERMLRPAAVNRWAEKAIIRSVPSIFQAYIIAVIELIAIIDSDDTIKSQVGDYAKVDKLNSIINRTGEVNFKSQLLGFICSAVGITHAIYGPSASIQFKDILKQEINNTIIYDLITNSQRYTSLRQYFDDKDIHDKEQKRSPMTSLRDIDPLGKITYEKHGNTSVDSSCAYEIMNAISNHGKFSED